MQSHHRNGLRTLLDNNINTLIKQSDTDITEWTEIVRGKVFFREYRYLVEHPLGLSIVLYMKSYTVKTYFVIIDII